MTDYVECYLCGEKILLPLPPEYLPEYVQKSTICNKCKTKITAKGR